MKTALTELLGVRYPIIQGGMAWISDASLAAGVSNAGGLGTIAAGNAPPDVVREQIRKARSLTDKPFAVNIMLLSPHAEQIVDLVIAERVSVVITGAGAPGAIGAKLKAAGIVFMPVVPSAAIAKHMVKAGADAVIAEGMEAGGHIGKLTTMCIVPQVVDAVNVPVAAAGGIADGRGMAAAFMLGADAVQIGTRFLVANECTVHPNYKAKIIKAKDIDTEVTGQITGHPVRALKNKLTARFIALEKEEALKPAPDMMKIENFAAGALRAAAVDGDTDNGSIMAGQIAGLVKHEQSCAEIVAEIMQEFSGRIGS